MGADLQGYKIYSNLSWLNQLPQSEAEAVFLACCGSHAWAVAMALARPFPLLDDLFVAAESIWFGLPPSDRLEAFASHHENSATGRSRELADARRLYVEKFGFIFILCTSGKSSGEIVAICRARLGNSVETELQIAAEEQRKITEIRLGELLER